MGDSDMGDRDMGDKGNRASVRRSARGKEKVIEPTDANANELANDEGDVIDGTEDIYFFGDSDEGEIVDSDDDDWEAGGDDIEEDDSDESDADLYDENENEIDVGDSDDGLLDDYKSDDSGDLLSSDEEGGARVRTKKFDTTLKGVAKPFVSVEGQPIVFEEGQVFGDVDAFRDALRDYCIIGGYNLKRDKNDSVRVTAHCLADGCPWRIHASVTPDLRTFMVKTLRDEHSCIRVLQNKNATSPWISKKLKSLLRADPTMSYELMSQTLADKYGIDPQQQQLYRAKRRAQEIIEGKHSHSYALLPKYAALLREKSPGTLVKIELHEQDNTSVGSSKFKRIFICYDAMKQGFLQGCRPFVGLDGCHLKGPFGGVLLSAVSVDGDKGLFPVAFAVVEAECKESWTFFLQHLYACIGPGTKERPLVFMSDQTKGLEDTVVEIFPGAKHRFCARHLFANFRKRFPGLDLRLDFWKAVRSYDFMQWKAAMDAMRVHNSNAFEHMIGIVLTFWARHTFHPGPKSDHTTNNMTESFNHWVEKFRNKPIIALLEGIRMKLMTLVSNRYGKGCAWETNVTPSALRIVNSNLRRMSHCQLLPASRSDNQVLEGTLKYVVNLRNRSCTCNEWDITGLPCRHALCCIARTREKVEDYCHAFFSKAAYVNTYSGMIPPLPEVDLNPENENDIIHPPPLRRSSGRPRVQRRREVGEPGARKRSCTVRCTNCQELGHNRRKCERAPVAKKRKSQGGRPKATDITRGSSSQATTSSIAIGSQAPSRGKGHIPAREMGEAPTRGRGRPPTRGRGMSQTSGRGQQVSMGRGQQVVRGRKKQVIRGRGQQVNRGRGERRGERIQVISSTQPAVPSTQYAPIRGNVQLFSTQQITSTSGTGIVTQGMREEGSSGHIGTQQSTNASQAPFN